MIEGVGKGEKRGAKEDKEKEGKWETRRLELMADC